MNRRQRAVLWLETVLLLVMIAVPPYFGIDRESEGRVHAHLGYFALWNPPTSVDACNTLRVRHASLADCASRSGAYESGLNKVRLSLNATSSLVVAGALFQAFRARRLPH